MFAMFGWLSEAIAILSRVIGEQTPFANFCMWGL
jgi:hypothetical protein